MLFIYALVGLWCVGIISAFLYCVLMARANIINEYGSVRNCLIEFWEGVKEDITPDCQKEKEDETDA